MSPFQMTTSETILIIDDQEQNLQLLRTLLTMTGHEVITASSGEQAMQQLQLCVPDLILLDVLMPEMNGIDVCRLIKADARWADLPVIFLSAADDKNLIVEALECGGVDYVTKPFNKAELLSRVRTHLALKRAREELRYLAEDKDELLGILTHDLGNHLAGIHMSASVLDRQRVAMPPQSAQLVVNIIKSTELIVAFVHEFLANQSAERLQVQPESVDLKAMLEQAAAHHAPMAAAKDIAFKLELPDHAVLALADPCALIQVLNNLVSNALKFSPVGSTVMLSAGAGQLEWAQFTVRDEGPGFSLEDLDFDVGDGACPLGNGFGHLGGVARAGMVDDGNGGHAC